MSSTKKQRRYLRGCAWGCGGVLAVAAVGVIALVWFLSRIPSAYPPATHPVPLPRDPLYTDQALDGFASPYLGHTGSWDGTGGAMGGASKVPELDIEQAMGLRWTFMCVYWRAMEPDGPIDLQRSLPPAWASLDAFVIAARQRKLNILMQAPVIGGNAGGPPGWAGRREEGKSAPRRMEAAADFAEKLAKRYHPGGILATQQGWGKTFGIRAWELDNEPEGYRTHWDEQAGDYAEFATRVARRVKAIDPHALILTPAIAGGGHGLEWVRHALDAHALSGSPTFRSNRTPYSIGPVTDVVSFHSYEGLDSAFSRSDRTLERAFSDIQSVFDTWAERADGFHYTPPQNFWHTEGNFDFLGLLSSKRRAAWRWQVFTRAFAAGIRKICVMDASPLEQVAVATYLRVLPDPFPMRRAADAVEIVRGEAEVFWHPTETGSVWILWARAGSGDAVVTVPIRHDTPILWYPDGTSQSPPGRGGSVQLVLAGDKKMAPPVILMDPSPSVAAAE